MKPKLSELTCTVINQHAAQWEDLGALLGLEDYDIANIAKDYRNQSIDACRQMLIKWLQIDTLATWGKLYDAIELLTPRGN